MGIFDPPPCPTNGPFGCGHHIDTSASTPWAGPHPPSVGVRPVYTLAPGGPRYPRDGCEEEARRRQDLANAAAYHALVRQNREAERWRCATCNSYQCGPSYRPYDENGTFRPWHCVNRGQKRHPLTGSRQFPTEPLSSGPKLTVTSVEPEQAAKVVTGSTLNTTQSEVRRETPYRPIVKPVGTATETARPVQVPDLAFSTVEKAAQAPQTGAPEKRKHHLLKKVTRATFHGTKELLIGLAEGVINPIG